MKYVSIAQSRAGSKETPKKRPAPKRSPNTSADPATSTTQPDDGLSVSKHEED